MRKLLICIMLLSLGGVVYAQQPSRFVEKEKESLIELALRIANHPRCAYDTEQKDYLKTKKKEISERKAKDSTLNVWNEEVNVLRSSLDEKQFNMLFSVRNVRKAAAKVNAIWRRLDSLDLVSNLDSVKEWNRAFRYMDTRMRISDIYRYQSKEKRRYLSDIKRKRPLLIMMSDAYERKVKGGTDRRIDSLKVDLEFGRITSAGKNADNIRKAIHTLKGLDNDMTLEEAVDILRQTATDGSDSMAMNALAVAYVTGTGVNIDTAQAIFWFEKAGACGNALAFHNLGMVYKYAFGGFVQNFEKACYYFQCGALLGSVVCHYDYGFMLYKGLGCRQNYSEAVSHFQKGVERLHVPSLYMLGLCYRNGFGVEQNIDKGNNYLYQAEVLGSMAALEELGRETFENNIYKDVSQKDIPQQMPEVYTDFTEANLLSGEFEGVLVQYDWSGQYVISEKLITMAFSRNGRKVTGNFLLNGCNANFSATLQNDGLLMFDSGEIRMHERYSGNDEVVYRLDEAKLDAWNEKIIGSLKLYSLKHQEPERPMYIRLFKKNNSHVTFSESGINITSNELESQITISMELEEDVPFVELRIYNRSGLLVDMQSFGAMSSGKHLITLTPSLPAGIYALNVKAGKLMSRALIAKKGGAR